TVLLTLASSPSRRTIKVSSYALLKGNVISFPGFAPSSHRVWLMERKLSVCSGEWYTIRLRLATVDYILDRISPLLYIIPMNEETLTLLRALMRTSKVLETVLDEELEDSQL